MFDLTSTAGSTPTQATQRRKATWRIASQRVRRLVLALLVAAATALGVGAPQASAYTLVGQTGSYGGLGRPAAIQAQYVSGYVGGVMSRYEGLRIPGLYVTRSNATSGAQAVWHGLAIEEWYGTHWVTRSQVTFAYVVIPAGRAGIYLPDQYQLLGSGTYRVTSVVTWADSRLPVAGARGVDYNGYDYQCRSGFVCTPGYGWVRIWLRSAVGRWWGDGRGGRRPSVVSWEPPLCKTLRRGGRGGGRGCRGRLPPPLAGS